MLNSNSALDWTLIIMSFVTIIPLLAMVLLGLLTTIPVRRWLFNRYISRQIRLYNKGKKWKDGE